MSLFDTLKRQAAQAARSAANQAGQNIVQGAKNAVSGVKLHLADVTPTAKTRKSCIKLISKRWRYCKIVIK